MSVRGPVRRIFARRESAHVRQAQGKHPSLLDSVDGQAFWIQTVRTLLPAEENS
jgi:hypothetical protein